MPPAGWARPAAATGGDRWQLTHSSMPPKHRQPRGAGAQASGAHATGSRLHIICTCLDSPDVGRMYTWSSPGSGGLWLASAPAASPPHTHTRQPQGVALPQLELPSSRYNQIVWWYRARPTFLGERSEGAGRGYYEKQGCVHGQKGTVRWGREGRMAVGGGDVEGCCFPACCLAMGRMQGPHGRRSPAASSCIVQPRQQPPASSAPAGHRHHRYSSSRVRKRSRISSCSALNLVFRASSPSAGSSNF